jgi:hypothetical protein
MNELTPEQEATISGGFRMGEDFLMFQDTSIDTFADSQTSLASQDGLSATTRNRTGYKFRQTTFVFFGGGGRGSLGRIFELLRRFL